MTTRENNNGDRKPESMAARVAAFCAGPDLCAAWNALKAHEGDIAGFIDNKVTPKQEEAVLPSLEDMQRRGVEKNAIQDDNPVTVIFSDGSALLLDAGVGIGDLKPPGTYPSLRKGQGARGRSVERIDSPFL